MHGSMSRTLHCIRQLLQVVAQGMAGTVYVAWVDHTGRLLGQKYSTSRLGEMGKAVA